jgi:ribosomal protein S18 acetylase RimI-like enzyme
MMAPPDDSNLLATQIHDAAGSLALREEVLNVYSAAHADQGHDPWAAPDRFWERLVDIYARTPDFAMVTARTDGAVVGYAFGSPREESAEIWQGVWSALPDVGRPDASSGPEPVYIFREFAVHPDWQRRGVGRALHDALLSTRPEPLAHLLVRQDNIRARAAYRSWGWRRIGQQRPFPDSQVFDAMVRALPLT